MSNNFFFIKCSLMPRRLKSSLIQMKYVEAQFVETLSLLVRPDKSRAFQDGFDKILD